MRKLLPVFLALVLTACEQKTALNIRSVAVKEPEPETQQPAAVSDIPVSKVAEVKDDTIVTISYDEFTVHFSRLLVYEHKGTITKMVGDTMELTIELGETIEGQLITFSDVKLKNIKVEQRYETSLTVMAEGPHCDLLDWKHYTSPWKTLKENRPNVFTGLTYTEKERELFPATTTKELRQSVLNYCGEWSWVNNDTAAIQSPTKYPCAVGISRYFIRITGTNPETGKTVIKNIIFNNLMGC